MRSSTVELQDGHVEDCACDEECQYDARDGIIDRGYWTATEASCAREIGGPLRRRHVAWVL